MNWYLHKRPHGKSLRGKVVSDSFSKCHFHFVREMYIHLYHLGLGVEDLDVMSQ